MGNNSAKHNLKWNIKISLCFCIILISLSLNQFGSVSYVLNQPLSVIKILDSWNDEYLFAYWRRTCAMEEKIFKQCLKRYISKLLSRFLQKAVYSSFHLYFCTNQQEISSCRMTWHVCGRISQKQVLLSQSSRPFSSCEPLREDLSLRLFSSVLLYIVFGRFLDGMIKVGALGYRLSVEFRENSVWAFFASSSCFDFSCWVTIENTYHW